jgi:hypothetical protein
MVPRTTATSIRVKSGGRMYTKRLSSDVLADDPRASPGISMKKTSFETYSSKES